MLVIPHLFLKNKKSAIPAEGRPVWFSEDPLVLSKTFADSGAEQLFITDSNIPGAAKSENVDIIEKIISSCNLPVLVSGNFRSIESAEPYFQIGVDKIILGAPAYQDPDFLKSACQKFKGKIAVHIQVRDKKVFIPGWIAPSHKTVLDYAERFEEQGISAFCYAEEKFETIQDFCLKTKRWVYALSDPQNLQGLEPYAKIPSSYFRGIVLGKPLYEDKIDLHGAIAFASDLAAGQATEDTFQID